MIDVRGILSELGIDIKTEGKNVGSNDINIDCPFCGAEKHLGIRIDNGLIWCWVCEFEDFDRRPSLLKALVEITGLKWNEVKEVMIEHGWEDISYSTKDDDMSPICKLPKHIFKLDTDSEQSEIARSYLSKRGFGDDIIKKYNLVYAFDGFYHKRIIIPVYLNKMLVTFTSRDYSGKDNRYKHAPLFKSSERIKNLLYNYDTAKEYKHIYLVEGPTDVWRIGDDSMCVFRSALSSHQRRLLINLKLDSITIIFDPLATARAYAAADDLSPFINKIKVVRLSGIKDVADRTRDEILNLEHDTRLYRG